MLYIINDISNIHAESRLGTLKRLTKNFETADIKYVNTVTAETENKTKTKNLAQYGKLVPTITNNQTLDPKK
jgi:hypothetical protein